MIDMKTFTGEATDSAAGGPPNSYQAEIAQDDVHVHKEFLEPAPEKEVAQPVQQSPQPEQDFVPQSEHFKALRDEVERIKAEKNVLSQNLELMRANMVQPKFEPPPQPKPLFEGLKTEDVPNVGEIEKAWAQREADYQARIEELQVAQAHSDYAEVLEKYTIPLLKQKPHLVQGIQGAQNKALQAYELGKMYQAASKPTPAAREPSPEAKRIVENAKKPGSLSSAGGQPSALSQADYISSMSDDEFMKFASKHLD